MTGSGPSRGPGRSVIDDLLAHNAAFAATFAAGSLRAAPHRRIAVLACMDARLDLPAVLGLRPGDAHVIRNAGGIATEDAIRSLVVSQRLLGSRAVMLVHHTDCGMLGLREDELKAQIEQETGVRPPFALEAFSDLEADVRQSLDRVRLSPYLPHRDQVRGFIYDVSSGLLREVESREAPARRPGDHGGQPRLTGGGRPAAPQPGGRSRGGSSATVAPTGPASSPGSRPQ